MKLCLLETELEYINKIESNIPVKLFFKFKEESFAFFLCDLRPNIQVELSNYIRIAKHKYLSESKTEIIFDELALLITHNIADKNAKFDEEEIQKGFNQNNHLNMKLYYKFDDFSFNKEDIQFKF